MLTKILIFLRFIRWGGVISAAKTIAFNFKMFPLKVAIKLPVLISANVNYKLTRKGSIEFEKDALRFGSLRFGFCDWQYSYRRPTFLKIQGRLIIRGAGFHTFANGLTLEIGEKAICIIGSDFSASHNNRIRILDSLTVGDNNMWSFDNVVMDNDAHHIFNSQGECCNPNKGIIIGNDVWMGCRTIILKGAEVPNGTIIATSSIVNKKYRDNNTIITSYGKVLRKNVTWSRKLT